MAVHEDGDFAGTERFEIVRRLGAGGMGVVYEALDRERNARVALKTLRSLNAQGILLFKREFRALQDVQHPNLISLGELIEERGQWFFTMELVRGVDFISYVRPIGHKREDEPTSRRPPPDDPPPPSDTMPLSPGSLRGTIPGLDESRLRTALLQLAQGLVSLHSSNKIHRDIKPSNILVTPSDRAVLLDFGLVTDITSTVARDNLLVGTVAYMAPEQAGFRSVGPEADWYSVGVLLYFALTGQLPFDGQAAEVLMRKQRLEPPPPGAAVPSHLHDLADLCVQLLRIDPARRPSGREVLTRLGGATLSSLAPPAPGIEPFVGRRDELARLHAAFQQSRTGQACVTCVHGESGVGKSALVRRFTEQLVEEHPEAVVLAGRCYERESVPYKALDGIVDALSHFMAALDESQAQDLLPRMAALLPQVFPVLGRVEGFAQTMPAAGLGLDLQETRTRSFTALRELLGRIAAWRPLLLVIDDYQWADADSTALLVEILRPPDPPPLLLVCTMRGEPGRRLPVIIPGQVQYLELGRLAPSEAHTLASELVALGGSEPTSDRLSVESIAREADGHPLFIDELVRHSRRVKGAAELHLDGALWSRVQRLEPGARELLEVVCVAGAPMTQDVAARAAGENDLAELARRITGLRLANLVRTTGSRGADLVEPYHDRVREAVLANLEGATRAGWHARIAVSMEATLRGDAEALATHFREAGQLEKAAFYARQAAKGAETSLAFDRAASLLRQALQLGSPSRPEARGLQVRLASALANAGRGREAAHAYLLAVEGAGAEEALELRRRAADQLLRSGHIDDGLSVLGDVLGAEGMGMPQTPRGALASLLWQKSRLRLRGEGFTVRPAGAVPESALRRVDVCWTTTLGLSLVDFIRAADFQARTMRLALDAGEVGRLARAFAVAYCFAVAEGHEARRRAPRLLEKAETLARRDGGPYSLAWIPLSRGIAAFILGHWRSCLSLCAEAEGLFREHGRDVAWEVATARAYGLWALGYMGDFKELGRRVSDGLHEARERGDRFAAVMLSTGACHYVHLANDDPESSRRESTEALRDWSHAGFHLQHVFDLFVQVETDLYAGDVVAAHARLVSGWPSMEGAMLLRLQNLRVFMVDLRGRVEVALALARGRDPELLRSAERRGRALEQEQLAWSVPLGTCLRACVALARGDDRAAIPLFERAARDFDTIDMQLHAAAVRERLGQLRGGDEGRALGATAREVFERQAIRAPQRITSMLAPG